MPKTRGEEGDYIISETGNWNVADTFSKRKIMIPLDNCDFYEDIALYGHASFLDELIEYQGPTDELKLRGLRRLVNELIKLAKNARFAMKKDKTRARLLGLQEKLYIIRDKLLPLTYRPYTDESQGIQTIQLNEDAFKKTLEAVSEIKAAINEPLNQNHLIFTDKEEFDPRAFKDRIKDRMINKG